MNLEHLAKDFELELLRAGERDLVDIPLNFIKEVDIPDHLITQEEVVDLVDWLEDPDLEDVVYRLMALVFLDRTVTAQALIGMFYRKVENRVAKRIIVDLMLNAVATHPAVEVSKSGMYVMFHAKARLSDEILAKRKQLSYVLPSLEIPLTVTDNRMIGYTSLKQSIICGGSLKHHDEPLNLAHINRVNRTPYRVETRLPFLVKPEFNSEPKMKDNGFMEDASDIAKRYQSWSAILDELPNKLALITDNGNKFYIHHRFDNGGRCYAKAHHFNYQGIAYCKALIQFSNKEVVEPDF